MIISISGTPGTGKTKIAKALAERLGWRLVELNELAKEKGFYAGYDDKRKCKIVDIDRVKKEIRNMEKGNRNMILESHYAQDMSCDIVVILRANPGELRLRLMSRSWTRKKIEENIQAEIMEVCKSDALDQNKEILEIDTTGKTAKATAEEIGKKLKF